MIPTDGLTLHAPLNEAPERQCNVAVDGNVRSLDLESGFAWDAGHVAAKAVSIKAGQSLEVADAGDFEKDQAFSCGVWFKFRNAAKRRLASPHGRATGYRGWDLWIEGDRVGIAHHQQLARQRHQGRGQDIAPAQPVVSLDGHLRRLRQSRGVKIYVNGDAAGCGRSLPTSSPKTIRTAAPFKIGQRNTSSRLPTGMALQDVRIYARALNGTDVEHIARGTRAGMAVRPSPRTNARLPRRRSSSTGGWWPSTHAYRDLRTPTCVRWPGGRGRSVAAAPSPT